MALRAGANRVALGGTDRVIAKPFALRVAPDGVDASDEQMAEVESEFMNMTVKSGMKFDNVSPLDMELPEGADIDA